MQKFTIRNYQTGEILHEEEAESFKEFVEMKKGNLQNADLESANLSDADLEYVDLSDANLRGANLRRADLENANLYGANLRGAELINAYLWGAYLERANLYGANLGGANLIRANLYGANLGGANFENADLGGANLGNANLYGANLKDSRISIYSKRTISIKLLDSDIEKQDINKILINIGCKEKTIAEWDTWFQSNEEYETKRGTFEFKQIQAMYKAYRAYVIELWS